MKSLLRTKSISTRLVGLEKLLSTLERENAEKKAQITVENIIQILQIEPEKRNRQQLIDIVTYLNGLDYFKGYIKDGK